jgi:NAD(P)-dependent dehydrogenase (short-subunit alcohol dehydrogenase family)
MVYHRRRRGLGLDIAKAAMAAGHQVVATGRNPEKVAKAVGASDNLLVVKLDVTSAADAKAAAQATLERFGRIDVLVNNAASFYAGYFEELTPEHMQLQLSTSLVGPMNVTRAFLPTMRKQRSGRIVSISSTAGLQQISRAVWNISRCGAGGSDAGHRALACQ